MLSAVPRGGTRIHVGRTRSLSSEQAPAGRRHRRWRAPPAARGGSVPGLLALPTGVQANVSKLKSMAVLGLSLAALGAVAVSAQPDPSTMKEIAPGVFLPILNLVRAPLEHGTRPQRLPIAT